jgi:Brp/Blh family beta-carotene 15,15'-monooxygenase
LPAVLGDVLTFAPLACALAAMAAAGVFPGALQTAGPWLLAVAVVVGLPHGAVDHLLPLWNGATMDRRRWALLLAGYLAAALGALAAMFFEPRATMALLALAALHFGCGEVAVAALRSGRAPSAIRAVAVAVGVGITIVAGPLALHASVTDVLLAGIHPDLPASVTPGVRIAALVTGLTTGALGVVLAAREGDPVTAAEVATLLTLPLIVPPLAAFAVFFGAWHAPRHTLRLLLEDPRNAADLRSDRLGRPLRRFLRTAAPTTALAAVGIGVLAAVAASGAPAVALAVLLALTVPHAIAVGWLDIRVARALR